MTSRKDRNDTLSLETFLPYRLNRLADAISRDFASIYRERYGLTRPEWRLLATLGQYGTMTASQIGKHSAMHKTKVSRAVTALAQRRWLKRERDAGDRRTEHLTLTKSGMQAYGELVPLARHFEAALFGRIGSERKSKVLDALDALEELIEDR